MTKVVFWDFHGTLTYDRYGWSGTMLHILETHKPEYAVKRETISHLLRTGFPWHAPEEGHSLYNDDAKGWWRASDKQMERVYNQIGVPAREAAHLAGLFRETYLGCTENFIPYPDTIEALSASRDMGYANVILSNHIPELSEIIGRLSFAPLLDHIITSGRVGYEKPHPAIFAHARQLMGEPAVCWMVGDNYTADCMGGLSAGFVPIWVHHEGRIPKGWDPTVARADTLLDVISIIAGEQTANG